MKKKEQGKRTRKRSLIGHTGSGSGKGSIGSENWGYVFYYGGPWLQPTAQEGIYGVFAPRPECLSKGQRKTQRRVKRVLRKRAGT